MAHIDIYGMEFPYDPKWIEQIRSVVEKVSDEHTALIGQDLLSPLSPVRVVEGCTFEVGELVRCTLPYHSLCEDQCTGAVVIALDYENLRGGSLGEPTTRWFYHVARALERDSYDEHRPFDVIEANSSQLRKVVAKEQA